VTGRDYRLGKLSLVDRAARIDEERVRDASKLSQAQRITAGLSTAGQDRRSGTEYAADLAGETDRSLAKSRNWQAGRPLSDHRAVCDCPPSLAGCVERQTWHTLADIPKAPPVSRALDPTDVARRNQRVARARRKGGRP
jgi:hypothetical protein